MNVLLLNPPVLSAVEERVRRAKFALAILKNRITNTYKHDNRWEVWTSMHNHMNDALNVDNLLTFQSHPAIAPQITGGSGHHFLTMIAKNYGQGQLDFLLKHHVETLCGNPTDLVFHQDAFITVTSMRHLFHVAKLKEYCNNCFNEKMNFVEIGAGYGNLARMVIQHNLCKRYHIIDHPVMHAIQYFFLSEFLPEEDIAIVSEEGTYLTGSPESRVQLLSCLAVESLKDRIDSPFVLLSTQALTEIPRESQEQYLDIFPALLIYIYGQVRIASVAGGRSSNGLEIDNHGLICSLAERYHSLQYEFHGFHFEYIGRSFRGVR